MKEILFKLGHAAISFYAKGEHGIGQGNPDIQDYIMHHVRDQVVIPLNLLGFDLSITKHVIMLWLAAMVLMISLPLIVRSKSLVPRGPINFIEWIIVFLKENVIEPQLGKDANRYAPYFLTAFFFVITCNLLGLVPMGSTATGDISVTLALALFTMMLVQYSAMRHYGFVGYFKSFVPGDVPKAMIPIIFIIEIMSMFTKHLSLAIRLFVNMVAGHLVIFAILSLIFMFKNLLISPFPVFGIIFISLLEILIAVIQAYIFTILSAVFVGLAIRPNH
ncbi:F0F1 ATP synthase subunit A [candidate division KSB1 bacterium]|nr:F0F1 ATP synthase subunit A [candidate division KSB1 bacterium]